MARPPSVQCCEAHDCCGFSRAKGAGDTVKADCWLKKFLPVRDRVAADGTYHTYLLPEREARNDAIATGDRGATTYTYHREPQPFIQAQETCVAAGGALASAHSGNENRAITAAAGPGSWRGPATSTSPGQESFWIGINDAAAEAAFVWADGSPTTYTNWNDGAPRPLGFLLSAPTR